MIEAELKTARERLGLTQAEFARAFAVNTRTLRGWELGARNGRPAAIPRAVAVLVREALRSARVRRELGIAAQPQEEPCR
jgi:transcriptional regulator with XRE-family HTH domain